MNKESKDKLLSQAGYLKLQATRFERAVQHGNEDEAKRYADNMKEGIKKLHKEVFGK